MHEYNLVAFKSAIAMVNSQELPTEFPRIMKTNKHFVSVLK